MIFFTNNSLDFLIFRFFCRNNSHTQKQCCQEALKNYHKFFKVCVSRSGHSKCSLTLFSRLDINES